MFKLLFTRSEDCRLIDTYEEFTRDLKRGLTFNEYHDIKIVALLDKYPPFPALDFEHFFTNMRSIATCSILSFTFQRNQVDVLWNALHGNETVKNIQIYNCEFNTAMTKRFVQQVQKSNLCNLEMHLCAKYLDLLYNQEGSTKKWRFEKCLARGNQVDLVAAVLGMLVDASLLVPLPPLNLSVSSGDDLESFCYYLPMMTRLSKLTVTPIADNIELEPYRNQIKTALKQNASLHSIDISNDRENEEPFFSPQEKAKIQVFCERNRSLRQFLQMEGALQETRMIPSMIGVAKHAPLMAPNAAFLGLLALQHDKVPTLVDSTRKSIDVS